MVFVLNCRWLLIKISIFQGEAHHDLVRDVRQNKGSILKVKRNIGHADADDCRLCCLTIAMNCEQSTVLFDNEP